METLTFEDIALLFVGVIATSMVFGGLIFWVVFAIRDVRDDDGM